MDTSPPQSMTRRWPEQLLIGLFFLILFLPILDNCFHIDPTKPLSENRLLAPLPARPHGIIGLKRFLADWEIYFNDHFGCRRWLVKWNNKLQWSWFGTKAISSALVGTDGWLYFSENQMLDHFRGAAQLTDQELRDWQKLLEHRRDWLAQRGIKYIFVLAPDKQSIYPEHLPVWLKDLGGRTKTDQFMDYMHAHSTVEVLDLRPVLLAGKKTTVMYQKTDTHWNSLGAFLAYANMVDRLKERQLPELPAVSLLAFDYTNHPTTGGDLARMLGVGMVESNAFFFTPKSELPRLEIFEPDDNHFKDPAFSKNPQAQGRAVVYQDSFGHYWVPFLGYQFGRVDFYWQYDLQAAQIEQPKPVVVINEMLERFFNVADPKKLAKQDALP